MYIQLGNPKVNFTIIGNNLFYGASSTKFVPGMDSSEFEETVYKPLNYTIFEGTTLSFSDINTLAKKLGIERPIYLGSIFVNLSVGIPETEFNISRRGLKFLSHETMKFYEIPQLKFEEISASNPKRGVEINGISLSREELDKILDIMDLVTHFRKH